MFWRTTRYFPFAGPAADPTTFQIDSGACDARTAIFMPSGKVSRLSPSYSFPLGQLVQECVRRTARVPPGLHDSMSDRCLPSSCVWLVPGLNARFHAAIPQCFSALLTSVNSCFAPSSVSGVGSANV